MLHGEMGKKPNGYWIYDRCKEEALKYTNRTDFRKNTNGAYQLASRNGWLYEFFPK